MIAAILVTQSAALAPDPVLLDMESQPVRLSDFRGKKIVLFTWASW
jgi:peroxiredoxin